MQADLKAEELAALLRTSAESGEPCAPLRDTIGVEDIDLAYRIQKINIDRRIAAGAKRLGYKIGLTSKKVQEQLGVDQPDFGVLLDDMQLNEHSPVSFDLLMQPKAEAEIAFIMAEDLDSEEITTEQLIEAVDYASAAIEVVGSRIENWNIKITDTVADNASASHYVLGEAQVKLADLDLLECKMEFMHNGILASEGKGAACLGSPVNAALWLARKMRAMGNPIQKGDVLLTGALGPMVNIAAGDSCKVSIEGLGHVELKFGESNG